MTHPMRFCGPLMPVLAALALVSAGCADSPALPTAPTTVLSRGAVPQVGTNPAADVVPSPNALGATKFMAFGDSITFGTLSSFDGAFLFDGGSPNSYPGQLESNLKASSTPRWPSAAKGSTCLTSSTTRWEPRARCRFGSPASGAAPWSR